MKRKPNWLPNLKNARFGAGLKQTELALKAGVSLATITKIEQRICGASAFSAKRLADTLGLDVWQLMSEDIRDLSKGKKSDA